MLRSYLHKFGTILVLVSLFPLTSCQPDSTLPVDEDSFLPDSVSLAKEATTGKHTFEDGSVYQGDLIRGKPDGFGRREFQKEMFMKDSLRKGIFRVMA